MSRILITGATGFIGRHLTRTLLAQGHQVITTGTRPLESLQAPWLEGSLYRPYDLNQPQPDPFNYFDAPEVLIHLAWQGLPNYHKLFHLERNLPASYQFIKQMVLSGLQQVTVLGTCFEYGMQSGPLSEDMPPAPVNAYACAKNSLRQFLTCLSQEHPFLLKWVRLFYLYGEGQSPNAILAQLQQALDTGQDSFNMSGGEQLRDYLPVETVAEYLARIALHPDFTGIVNCCSGQPVSIRKLVEDYLVSHQRSLRLNLGYYPYSTHEPHAFWGHTARLQQVLAGSALSSTNNRPAIAAN